MQPAEESSSCMVHPPSPSSLFFCTTSLFSCFRFLLFGVLTGVLISTAAGSQLSPLILFLTFDKNQLKKHEHHLLLPLLALVDLHRVAVSLVDQPPGLHLFRLTFPCEVAPSNLSLPNVTFPGFPFSNLSILLLNQLSVLRPAVTSPT